MKSLIYFGASIVYGIAWGIIYLLFAAFHQMPVMFNNNFIFFIARIFNAQLDTVFSGFIFAFIDGLLFGLIPGTIFLIISKIPRKINSNGEIK